MNSILKPVSSGILTTKVPLQESNEEKIIEGQKAVPSRVALPVLSEVAKEPLKTEYQLERDIGWLQMNNEYKKAIPLALELLLSKGSVDQSECISVAGICLLGRRHDIYLAILQQMPRVQKDRKILTDIKKIELNNFKIEVEDELKAFKK